jgi:hypothetical protein
MVRPAAGSERKAKNSLFKIPKCYQAAHASTTFPFEFRTQPRSSAAVASAR